jgi:nitronate monooxygenase/enoyl-[acyl-carrier protein] reductase II
VGELQAQWERLRRRTDRPFAINHQPRPFDQAAFAATLQDRPAAISYHMGDPGDLVVRAHDVGIRWIQQVMDVDQARQAVDRGVDVIVAQGGEAGGHSGFVSTMVLVPQVVDVAGATPVVAAGGIGDGRGLAAALALGAQGVAMGTRFLASVEMRIDEEWKRLLVEASSRDAQHDELLDLLLPPYNRPHYPAVGRMLPTAFSKRWTGHPEELAARAGELAPTIVSSVLAGRGHEYVPFAGQSVGLVDEVLPAAEIVHRTCSQASAILARLAGSTERGQTRVGPASS